MYVYSILNKVNNRIYIGSTNNYIARKHEHFGSLRNGKHHNRFLQSDFKIYGEKAFVFEVLINDIKDRTKLLLKEYDLILRNKDRCYNKHFDCPVSDPKKKQNWKMFKKGFIPNANEKAKKKRLGKQIPDLPTVSQILSDKIARTKPKPITHDS